MAVKYLVSATKRMELPFNKRVWKTRRAEDLEEKLKFDLGHLKFEMLCRHLGRPDTEARSSELPSEVLQC